MWYKEIREKICRINRKLNIWIGKYFEDLDGEEWYWCKGNPEASRISGFGVEKTFGDPFPSRHDIRGEWIMTAEYKGFDGYHPKFTDEPLSYFNCPIPEEIACEIRQDRGMVRPNHRRGDLTKNDPRFTFYRGCYE